MEAVVMILLLKKRTPRKGGAIAVFDCDALAICAHGLKLLLLGRDTPPQVLHFACRTNDLTGPGAKEKPRAIWHEARFSFGD
jgi:hypothetical protein